MCAVPPHLITNEWREGGAIAQGGRLLASLCARSRTWSPAPRWGSSPIGNTVNDIYVFFGFFFFSEHSEIHSRKGQDSPQTPSFCDTGQCLEEQLRKGLAWAPVGRV